MVFGTTYCAISHLEINEDDMCILLPLGFNLAGDFDLHNKADVNCFLYLYRFIDAPQEVIYKGNPDCLEYLDKAYERRAKHELYMLVHLEFYNSIIKELDYLGVNHINDFRYFKTVSVIYEKAVKYHMNELRKNTKASAIHIPEWMKNVYKIAIFIDSIGMIPYPSVSVSQTSNFINMYDKIRDVLKNK